MRQLTVDDFQIIPRGMHYPLVGEARGPLVKVRFWQNGNKRGAVAPPAVATPSAIQRVADHVGVVVEFAATSAPEEWTPVRPTPRPATRTA